LWKYLALLTGFAMLQTLSVIGFLHLSFNTVLIDALVFTVTYAILAILIWNTLKYGKFGSLPFLQEALIYIALIGLSLIVIFGIGYGLYEYLLPDNAVTLFSFLPVRMFLSLLVVLLIIQYFRFKICNYNFNEQPDTSEVPETNEEIIKPTKTEILDHIAVKSGSKIHVVLVPDIVCLQSDGDYVQIITTTGKYLKEQTMKYFEENLPSTLFVRVHRTCIVNMQAIARIELYDKQSQQLTLKNGHQIKVSQAGYKLLRSKLHL
jgi:DNA-binding LytR/AlgR family response regulator